MQEDNFQTLLERANQLKKSMQDTENSLESKHFDAKHQGVQITMLGNQRLVAIRLDPDTADAKACEITESILKAAEKAYNNIETFRRSHFLSLCETLQDKQENT